MLYIFPLMSDDRTREMKAIRRERRRKTLTEKGVDLVVVGLITFIAGFWCGVAWMVLAAQ